MTHRTGLDITQFTSIATVPTVAPGASSQRFWGGTQDNGTQRKSVNSHDAGSTSPAVTAGRCSSTRARKPERRTARQSCYVYGTYFGISPYRFTDGGAAFFSNQFIQSGINLGDRSDFYVPCVMNQLNPNQLFVGTYRLYRTDNAQGAAAHVERRSARDLTTRLHRHRSERRAHLRDLGDRRRRRHRPSTSGTLDGLV